jgi:hypothetical protein
MGSPYAGGGSKTHSPFATRRSSTSSKKKGGGHFGFVTHFVEHLASDAKDMAMGIPSGIVHTAKHPVATTKEVGKATWHDWSPLFKGHVGQFGHQFYDHPLAPLLDVASVLTLGTGSAARVSKALADAGMVGEASKIARFSKYAQDNQRFISHPTVSGRERPSMPKFYSKNPASKMVEQKMEGLSDALSKHLPSWFGKNVVGPEARYQRLELKDSFTRRVAMQQQIATYVQAAHKLQDPHEREALLRHAYDQLNTMAFKHDASKPVPEGFRAIRALPTLAKVKLSRSSLEREQARLAGLGANLSKHFKVKVDVNDAQSVYKAQGSIRRSMKRINTESERIRAVKTPKDPAKYAQTLADNEKAMKGLLRQESLLDKIVAQRETVGKVAKEHNLNTRAHVSAHSRFFKTSGDFEQDMKKFGNRYTVAPNPDGFIRSRKNVAMADDGKHVLIVPNHTLKRFELEGSRSSAVLKAIYHKPTRVWKSIILGYTPRYLVNNAVGNTFMYAMAESGPAGFRAYVDALRQTKKEGRVIKDLKSTDDVVKRSWQDKWFKDQLNNTLGYSNLSHVVNPTKRSKLQEGLFPVTHTWADQVLRRATLIKVMRENPEFKAFRKKGLDENAAANRVLHMDAQNGGALRRGISKRVEDSLGDYHTLNEAERKLRNIVPFYQWDRHIMRHTKHLLKEHTTRLNALAKTGQLGADETRQALGQIPDFLTGALPLSMLGIHVDHNNRKAILTTQGLNPYATVSELVDAAKQATVGGKGHPGESIGSTLNPFLANAIQALTGHSLLSDAPMPKHGGVIPTVGQNVAESLPYVKLAEKLSKQAEQEGKQRVLHRKKKKRRGSGGGSSNPFKTAAKSNKKDPMYSKNVTTDLLALLGTPVKQYSPTAGAKFAKQHNK